MLEVTKRNNDCNIINGIRFIICSCFNTSSRLSDFSGVSLQLVVDYEITVFSIELPQNHVPNPTYTVKIKIRVYNAYFVPFEDNILYTFNISNKQIICL